MSNLDGTDHTDPQPVTPPDAEPAQVDANPGNGDPGNGE